MLTICLSAMIFSTTATAQQNFSVSLNGVQVVPMRATNGRGSCLVTLNSTETQFTVNCTYTGTTSAVVGAHIHDTGPVGVNGPIRFDFNYTSGTGGTSGTIGPLTFDVTPAQVADLRAKRWYANIHTTQFPGGEIRAQVKIASTVFDLDGDGRTDITAFRQSSNTFFVLNSVNNSITANQFGSGTGDIWLNNTGDFDGDGRGDPILIKFNATRDAFHSILQTGSNTIRTVQWGNFGAAVADSLAYGDYDGDAKQDIAVFRRSSGFWYIFESSTNTGRVVQNFGAVNDFQSVGDYDGDGKTDLCVVRFESGQRIWYIQNSSNGQSRRVPFGAEDSFYFFSPVDVDGDGKQDILVNRTINGQRVFFVLRSSDNQVFVLTWGLSTDTALFGDYDGDGRTDFVARRNIGGQLVWFILQSSNNYNTTQQRTVFFGAQGDSFVEEIEDAGVPVDNF